MKAEHNVCIDCPASLACISMRHPFVGGKFEQEGISDCIQYYCPECFRPWVVHTLGRSEVRTFDWSVAPRSNNTNGSEMCEDCKEVREWQTQAANYGWHLKKRRDIRDGRGGYHLAVDTGGTDNSAVQVFYADTASHYENATTPARAFYVRSDLADTMLNTQSNEPSIKEIEKALVEAVKKRRHLEKYQKARRRENLERYWGGKKP